MQLTKQSNAKVGLWKLSHMNWQPNITPVYWVIKETALLTPNLTKYFPKISSDVFHKNSVRISYFHIINTC